jgi:hypothetical protein
LDFATILFNKGLHKQSLKILDKAKGIALNNEDSTLAFSIVELEKVVESQYITRSLSSRADDLILQSKDLGEKTLMLSKLSNLSIQLYSMLLKKGYVSNDKDFDEVRSCFKKLLPEYNIKNLGVIESCCFLIFVFNRICFSSNSSSLSNTENSAIKFFSEFPPSLPAYNLNCLFSDLVKDFTNKKRASVFSIDIVIKWC